MRGAERVLRPGGVFLAVEIQDGWLNRITHIRSTFVPVAPASLAERLAPDGFSNLSIAYQGSAYRLRAERPRAGDTPYPPRVDAAAPRP